MIGIAPTGGKLPASWRATILDAIRAGLDVHSGLHTFLGDDPDFAAAAAAAGTRIVDYRRPPDRLETAVGRRHGADKRVILTVGTDCAIGKMSVALELRAAAQAAGRSASFVPTGQTGMMIDGWGAAVDRLRFGVRCHHQRDRGSKNQGANHPRSIRRQRHGIAFRPCGFLRASRWQPCSRDLH